MARPIKRGLDYFTFDVDFFSDIKIRRIRKDCGNQSIPILIEILCSIYREEGYYLGINSDVTFLIAEQFGVSEGAVEETVRKAVEVGFFDRHMFNTNNILTSRSIQKRYLRGSAGRQEVEVIKSFCVLNFNDLPRNAVIKEINGVNKPDNTQSKEKESKVNNTILSGKPDDTSKKNYPYEEIIIYLNEVVGSKYRATSKKTQSLIRARIDEGFCLDDFKKVIDIKNLEWSKNDQFSKYLRPETLFGTKFESYLNQNAPKNATITDEQKKDADIRERTRRKWQS